MNTKGLVYLIGAGPGDPGLLTVKGKDILNQADVVIYDHLVGQEIMAWVNEKAELIYVGKTSGHHAMSQEKINDLLVAKAHEGKIVARLKGGDPFVFGRGGEEAQALREEGFDFEVIPGITSAIAVPTYAGIPVTHRDATSSFAVITGHEKPGKATSSIQWEKISTGIGTLVFLMGVENLPFIVKNLLLHGRDPQTPVALVRNGTLPDQQVVTGTLEDIVQKVQEAHLQPPAIIIVGETVALRSELGWLERKPLWGKTIVVTRARTQASGLLKKIRDLGGEAIEFPAITIQKENDLSSLYDAFTNLASYNWLIFTSVNAVEIFFEEMKLQQLDIRKLSGIKIAAIGPATRERLEKLGLMVDLVPDEYRVEAIVAAIRPNLATGDKVLLPRARNAREILPDEIRKMGVSVDEILLYEAVPTTDISATVIEQIRQGKVDYICFTSSSTVHNFVQILGAEWITGFNQSVKVACIGPVTAESAREKGFSVDLIAGEYTIQGLLNVIIEDVASGGGLT